MPPPLSTNDSAPSTSSTSGLRPVAESGMLSPSESRPVGWAPAGSSSATYFSPRRLVCRISATVFAGRSRSLRTCMVIFACQPTRSIWETCPTGTSSTITAVRGTTLSASVNSAVIVIASPDFTALPPGSGRS